MAAQSNPQTTKIIVETYSGDHTMIASIFAQSAAKLVNNGYLPISQSWAPNPWGFLNIFWVVLLCPLIIGIPFLIKIMADKPGGTLTVIYYKK